MTTKKRGLTDLQKKQVLALRSEGHTFASIAKKVKAKNIGQVTSYVQSVRGKQVCSKAPVSQLNKAAYLVGGVAVLALILLFTL